MRFASYPIIRAAASFAVCLLLTGLNTGAVAQDKSPPTGSVIGFEDGAGKKLFLHDFKGKPVLINLWATWCAPCVAEMPSLAKLQQDYAARGLTVIAMSEDDTLEAPLAFYKAKKITALPPYFDRGHAVWTAMESRGVPTTMLVTRQGDLVQRIEGPVDWNAPQVRAMIDELVK